MDIQKFKTLIKEAGLTTKKRRDLEVLDVTDQGVKLFSIRYAEVFSLTEIHTLLTRKRKMRS